MPFPAVLLVFVLAAPASASAALTNADFERVQKPGEGKYACPFANWLFIARSGEYSISGDQADQNERTAVIRCIGEEGRADLMSQGMEIPPLTEVRLRMRVRHEGATTAVVALHPPMNRGLVDVALIDLPRKGWGRFETRLKTATKEGSYRITVALIGGGTLHVDDIELDVGEPEERPVGRVMIVDLNPRLEDYVVPEAWWLSDEIEGIWGYEVVVVNYFDLAEARMREVDPVAVILSPLATRDPPAVDPEEKKQARARALELIARLRRPSLGICLGHQFLGMSAGARMGKQGEKGVVPVERLEADPIFEGLPPVFPCDESHRFALMNVPRGFVLLASSQGCEVQVIKKKRRPVYGFQGHFERGWTGMTPHGRILLGNFFDLVEVRRR